MLDKLASLETKYNELESQISKPEIIADNNLWRQLAKSHSELTEVISVYREYKQTMKSTEEAREMMLDNPEPDFREMLELELEELSEKEKALGKKLRLLLLPKDPNDEKNVLIEIRAGTGGEEAALFAADLFRMYTRYAEKQGWKSEIMNTSFTDIDGIKEVIFLIEGKGAYSKLKFESGVHRVQRVPSTESSGRIHTSASTVAVLPEAEELEIEINPNDIRIDLFCATGPGGQSVNTTQSAVRLTHIPSGIVVSMQDEKSQHKNKDKAMRILRARVKDKIEQEQKDKIDSDRKSQVGSGDRSERIRTYNFPQNRVTDHRIGLTSHRLPEILMGELDEIIDALVTTDQADQLGQTL
ncbi:MAG: peptide chain release factor 1 [Peptococcaceae bacterium]|nr:peptide chain release factor 1 [Peptococcaceae bacterium]